MSITNDGGPAFPMQAHEDRTRPTVLRCYSTQEGMSLRDWFAGMALQGLLANYEIKIECGTFAKVAYRHADQMIASRERKEDA